MLSALLGDTFCLALYMLEIYLFIYFLMPFNCSVEGKGQEQLNTLDSSFCLPCPSSWRIQGPQSHPWMVSGVRLGSPSSPSGQKQSSLA